MLPNFVIQHFNIGEGRIALQQVFVLTCQLRLRLLVVKGAELEVETS